VSTDQVRILHDHAELFLLIPQAADFGSIATHVSGHLNEMSSPRSKDSELTPMFSASIRRQDGKARFRIVNSRS
jgi:hypothetical protein